MEVAVLDKSGKETGRKVILSDDVFGIEPNEHSVYLEVKRHLAAKRQGTHKSKERNEIAGSTRKIKKQKGTGTARAGSIKSPIFRGGGTIFGPRPRSYDFKVNKSQKRLAKKSALSDKLRSNALRVLEDITFDAPKTKDFLSLTESLDLKDKKAIFVLGESNNNLYLSSRNLKRVNVVSCSELSVYDVVNASELVLLEASVGLINETLSR